jgi:hypothetical protein
MRMWWKFRPLVVAIVALTVASTYACRRRTSSGDGDGDGDTESDFDADSGGDVDVDVDVDVDGDSDTDSDSDIEIPSAIIGTMLLEEYEEDRALFANSVTVAFSTLAAVECGLSETPYGEECSLITRAAPECGVACTAGSACGWNERCSPQCLELGEPIQAGTIVVTASAGCRTSASSGIPAQAISLWSSPQRARPGL